MLRETIREQAVDSLKASLVMTKKCNIQSHDKIQNLKITGVLCFKSSDYFIMKTCPSYEYPLIPNFYIAKLGYAGIYLFFLLLP